MVVFDADILSILLHPATKVPIEPGIGKPIEKAQERLQFLVKKIEKARDKIIIPAPALSEFLVLTGDESVEYLSIINKYACFRVVPFGQKAAVEAAVMTVKAKSSGNKKSGSSSTWVKIKFDRQIVAIAVVENATAIYSMDSDVKSFADKVGINVIGVSELPLPPPETKLLPFQKTDGE